MDRAALTPTFSFRQFALTDRRCGMKIGTDGVLLGAWAGDGMRPRTVFDIGAGCGLIGLMACQRFAEAEVYFVENDSNAVKDLEYNINASSWASRCRVVAADFASAPLGRADLIVCNPPFFLTGEKAPDQSRAAARHAAALSPLSAVEFASAHLTPEGRVALIFPAEMLPAVEECAAFARLSPVSICSVATAEGKRPARVMAEFTFASAPCRRSELTVRDRSGRPTAAYAALTRDFYLHIDG